MVHGDNSDMDKLTPARRSENMRRIKSKDMKPEMAVRRMVHGMGYRYRLHRQGLPGRPDLVFGPRRKVIFVHGCFWHGHEALRCPIARKPKSNRGYWGPKLRRTKERDKENTAALKAEGWKVLEIWECELKHPARVERRIRRFLGNFTRRKKS